MRPRVLIVEDELIVADDLEWKLTNLGCDVTGIAASGEEALAMVDREQPDIVLMDIQLRGGMNGLEAAKRIHRGKGARIIFVTAFPAVFLKASDKERLPGLCVSKPFSTLQLKSAIGSLASAVDGTEEAPGP